MDGYRVSYGQLQLHYVWGSHCSERRLGMTALHTKSRHSPLAKELHPTQERVYVAAGIVRWVRGEEYGVETLVMDDEE